MAQQTDAEYTKNGSPPVVDDLIDLLPQTKFEINCKDKKQLIQDIHYIGNHLMPLNENVEYTKDTDVSKSSYTVSVVEGGITNHLYLLTSRNALKDKDKPRNIQLLVRIYGENTEVLIERDREEKLFYELGHLGFGPKLYAIFGNGRIEQWYPNAHSLQLHQRVYCKPIAVTIAEIHSIRPVLLKSEETESCLWTTLDKWYGIASNIEFKENNDKQKRYESLNWNNIPKQLEIMKSFLPSDLNDNKTNKIFEFIIAQQTDDHTKQALRQRITQSMNKIACEFMFEVVFSHNDLVGGNILHLEDTDEIKFVDFEYGGYNYRGLEFANHFCEYAGFDCAWEHFPDRDHMKQYLNDYIGAICAGHENIKNLNQEVLSLFRKENNFSEGDYDEFLDNCCDIIVAFTCVNHYWWGLWSVVQSNQSPIDFPFLQYAEDRMIYGYQYSLTLLPNYLKFVNNWKPKV